MVDDELTVVSMLNQVSGPASSQSRTSSSIAGSHTSACNALLMLLPPLPNHRGHRQCAVEILNFNVVDTAATTRCWWWKQKNGQLSHIWENTNYEATDEVEMKNVLCCSSELQLVRRNASRQHRRWSSNANTSDEKPLPLRLLSTSDW